jgi:tetratricopeptide (TPR) repeat protein/transcriptional regulator with XRE-family HTH domain
MASAVVALSTSFGALLKRYRRAAGLSQEELAERAGYSVGHISKLETSIRLPAPATAELLADALELAAHERSLLLRAGLNHNHNHILTMYAIPIPRAAPAPPLVNRQREVALLERLATELDVPPMALLAGVAGIGKSRLLTEAVEHGWRNGWTVLQGQSYRFGADGPFTPVLGALAAYVRGMEPARLRDALRGCSWIVRMLPELAEAGVAPMPMWEAPAEQERRLMFAAVRRFLSNIAGPAGTLLALDNLQWASADGLDLLAALMRDSAGLPLRVIGGCRLTAVDAQPSLPLLVAEMAQAGMLIVEDIEPLAPTAARELLDTLLAGTESLEAAAKEEALCRAGGNPLVLVSYARAFQASIEQGQPPSLAAPAEVAQVIRQGMGLASAVAQHTVQVMAVAGRPMRRDVVVAVAGELGHSELEVATGLDDACRARVLVEQVDGSYTFTNSLIAEVIDDDLGAAQRAYLHRMVAAALERSRDPSDAQALADHYGLAGETEKAVTHLARAGKRAEALHANAEAERYYRELVRYQEQRGQTGATAAAREHLGTVLGLMGKHDDALTELNRALREFHAVADRDGQGRAAALLGWIYGSLGRPEEGVRRLKREVAHAGLLSARSRALMFVSLARLHFLGGGYASALQAGKRATELARATQDQRLLVMAEMEHGAALDMLGRGGEDLRILEEMVIPLAEALDDPWLICQALARVTHDHLALGEFAQAGRAIARWQVIAERLEDRFLSASAGLASGELRFYLGAWKQAHSDLLRAEGALRSALPGPGHEAPAPGPSMHIVQAAWASAWLGRLLLAKGRYGEAARHLHRATALAAQGADLGPRRLVHCALGERALLEKRVDDAIALLEPLLDQPGHRDATAAEALPLLVWGHLERGAAHRAATLAAESIQRAEAAGARTALPGALCAQAGVATRQGDWRAATAALDDAVTRAQSLPYPYAEAKALAVYGWMHAVKGEPEEARQRYQQALAICARLGEQLYAERIRNALAHLEP